MKTTFTLILIASLASCTSVTTIHPDGTSITTRSMDPTTSAILAASLSEIAKAKIIAEK